MKDLLAGISVIGFIIVSVLAFIAAKYGEAWAMKMMDTILPMIVQAWILNFAVIIQYHYGSSAGSMRKTDMLEKKNQNEIIELRDEVK